MADEKIRQTVMLLEVPQQIDNLSLHRHVQGTGRLIEDDEAGLQDHRSGDGDTLALTTAELVRVAVDTVG